MNSLHANEPHGWMRFHRLYSGLILYWIRQFGAAPCDEDDLRQEVFAAVVRAMPRFDKSKGRGSFRGWLHTIARNEVADSRRKQHPRPDSPLLAVVPVPRDESNERQQVYLQALELIRNDFSPTTWQMFWAVVVEDRAPAEVAETLGLTINAVYLAKARVLRRLRDDYGNFLD